jgi:hypothetical protein
MVASTMAYSMSGSSEAASKSRLKTLAFTPVSIPLEDGVPRPEQRWQIAPRAAGSRDPQHRLDKAPVILTAATGIGLLSQAVRRQSF